LSVPEEWNGRCTLIDVPWLTGLSQGFFFGSEKKKSEALNSSLAMSSVA
jgi:hypothetical protein